MLETITISKIRYCGDCALWMPLTKEEHALRGYPLEQCWGTCLHLSHKCKAIELCIFVNSFCSLQDYNCETCSREGCPLHKLANNKNGCVTRWRHQLAKAIQ